MARCAVTIAGVASQQRDTDIKPIKTSNLVPVAASDLTTPTTLDWVRKAEFAIRSIDSRVGHQPDDCKSEGRTVA